MIVAILCGESPWLLAVRERFFGFFIGWAGWKRRAPKHCCAESGRFLCPHSSADPPRMPGHSRMVQLQISQKAQMSGGFDSSCFDLRTSRRSAVRQFGFALGEWAAARSPKYDEGQKASALRGCRPNQKHSSIPPSCVPNPSWISGSPG